jgi:zinc protease
MEDQALQAYVKKQTSILENMMSNPNNYFGEVVNKIRYQDHPRRGTPLVEDLQKVKMTQMQSIYRDRFSDMGDFTFFFTGAIDPAQLRDLASRYFGSLPVTERTETWKDIGVTSPEGTIDSMFQRGEAPKSNVRIIYHGDFTWDDESRVALQMMLEHARIKLRESLREDMGGVYGVSLSGGASKEPKSQYSINVSFNCDPPRTDELVKAAYAVIQDIIGGNITAEDIQKVKELQRQTRVKNLQENRYWHSGMINHWIDGTPLEQLTQEHLDQVLETVTPEMIQMAATRYFTGNKIEAVMHPKNFVVSKNRS